MCYEWFVTRFFCWKKTCCHPNIMFVWLWLTFLNLTLWLCLTLWLLSLSQMHLYARKHLNCFTFHFKIQQINLSANFILVQRFITPLESCGCGMFHVHFTLYQNKKIRSLCHCIWRFNKFCWHSIAYAYKDKTGDLKCICKVIKWAM